MAETCVFAGFTPILDPVTRTSENAQQAAGVRQLLTVDTTVRVHMPVGMQCAGVCVCVRVKSRGTRACQHTMLRCLFKEHDCGEGPESLTRGIFIPTEGGAGESDSPSFHPCKPPRRVTVRIHDTMTHLESPFGKRLGVRGCVGISCELRTPLASPLLF